MEKRDARKLTVPAQQELRVRGIKMREQDQKILSPKQEFQIIQRL